MSPSVSRFTSPLRNNAKASQGTKDGGAAGTGKVDGGNANGSRTNSPNNNNNNNNNNSSNTLISATLSEALRNNPFGSTSRSRAVEAEAQATARSIEERHRDLDDLNRSLVVLAELFPDVRIEVFRELLTRFDGQSRLHVCVEQLLRHKKQWVQGRWNIPVEKKGGAEEVIGQEAVAPEELFRSETYRNTVKGVLCKEFSGLSRSTVEGVLAEVNFSYSRARPTLKELSRKSWRTTIVNLNPFRRKKDSKDDNPLVIWERSRDGGDGGTTLLLPRLKHTGSDELDQEIHQAYIAPLLQEQRELQEYQDYCLATDVNEKEAVAGNALYECQCCLDDVAFEEVSACSSECHMICFNCIRRTLHEAVFGQTWDNSVDSERATLKCVAPVSHGVCEGHLDPMLVKRAILFERAGCETYRKFEDRLASEALLKTNLRLVRCPFCSYAEIDPIFHPSSSSSYSTSKGKKGGLRWRFRRDKTLISTILTTIILLDLIPLLLLPFLILLLLYPQTATALFHNSLKTLCLRSRSQRFPCKNPTCRQVSCMTCHKPWRDPHTCEEPLQQSLRTTVEAARTAAVKRTCPRCNLSFVKSSGCNKLTCVCGYSMCYICRKALNGPSSDADADGGQSGYKHFCEHFRVNPGTRCTECNKCELYFAEDDEAIARKAGEKAEREWRLRQSIIASNNLINNNPNHRYPQRNQPTTNINTTTTDRAKRATPQPSSSSSSIFQFPWNNNNTNPQSDKDTESEKEAEQQFLLPPLPANNNNDDPYRLIAATTYNHSNRSSWHYWLVEVWQEKDRWKWEIQGLADRLVERVVVVDDDYELA